MIPVPIELLYYSWSETGCSNCSLRSIAEEKCRIENVGRVHALDVHHLIWPDTLSLFLGVLFQSEILESIQKKGNQQLSRIFEESRNTLNRNIIKYKRWK